jgi:hypothetical protein
MKTLEWLKALETQRQQQGKAVFTVTELANVARHAPAVLSVELGRLCRRGVLVRYAQGRYGLPGAASPETLLSSFDPSAYITGAFALYRHNLIAQVPVGIVCFTNRRHNRSRVRQTPVGRFTFVCVRPPVYARPQDGWLAGPEQALCDYVLLNRRQGIAVTSQVTFRGLHTLDPATLQSRAALYPKIVQVAIFHLLRQHQ